MKESISIDHSDKSILARGCDPILSKKASEFIPPQIGNPSYVPTTDDDEFIRQLKSQKWSVVYFAPGACRYSHAKKVTPGSNNQTRGWTLEEFKTLIHELQGDQIQIVETMFESESIDLLKKALDQIDILQ